MTAQKINRVPEILEQLGVSRSTLARFVKYDPTFPKPFKIGARSTGILQSELDAWIQSRVDASRQTQTSEQ